MVRGAGGRDDGHVTWELRASVGEGMFAGGERNGTAFARGSEGKADGGLIEDDGRSGVGEGMTQGGNGVR